MTPHGNDPAFPDPNVRAVTDYKGLTKREWLAGMAMQGLLSNSYMTEEGEKRGFDRAAVSEWAVKHADALLAALHKTEKSGE